MAFLNSSVSGQNKSLVNANAGWAICALSISALILLPIVSVIFMALFPANNIWPHLISTTLPR
ncbi:MAG: hypothetical protein VW124_27465, partial [Paracoccaceae bacterium]